jgi:hypothetical protein
MKTIEGTWVRGEYKSAKEIRAERLTSERKARAKAFAPDGVYRSDNARIKDMAKGNSAVAATILMSRVR